MRVSESRVGGTRRVSSAHQHERLILSGVVLGTINIILVFLVLSAGIAFSRQSFRSNVDHNQLLSTLPNLTARLPGCDAHHRI